MEKKVLKFIRENRILEQGDRVVLGVSGGADSMCLLNILNDISKEMKLELVVVHVNHHVRGEEADADQKFVEDFCKELQITCIVEHIDMDALAEELKCSKEEAGRIARYDIFEQVRSEYNAQKIAVAHNMNDDSETILFNMFRGTGIKGLCGIRPVRDYIVRPVLCLTRDEIEYYLEAKEIPYRTDSTNLCDDYARNRIRNNVIPYLEQNINANAALNIAKAGSDLAEIEDYLEIQTKIVWNKCVKNQGNGYIIQECLIDEHSAIQGRVVRLVVFSLSNKLKDITRQHIKSVLDLFDKNTGRQVDLPYELVAERTYSGVWLSVKSQDGECNTKQFPETTIYENGQCIPNKIFSVEIENNEKIKENIPDLVYTKWIDCDKIKGGLVVRTRRTGDYFVVDNQGNKKKIKEYFINEKIPKNERDNILLVAEGNHVLWVVGHRISSEYKVTSDTKKILKLSFNKDSDI